MPVWRRRLDPWLAFSSSRGCFEHLGSSCVLLVIQCDVEMGGKSVLYTIRSVELKVVENLAIQPRTSDVDDKGGASASLV